MCVGASTYRLVHVMNQSSGYSLSCSQIIPEIDKKLYLIEDTPCALTCTRKYETCIHAHARTSGDCHDPYKTPNIMHDTFKTICSAADKDTTFEHWKDRMIQNSCSGITFCRLNYWSSSLSDHTEKETSLHIDVLKALVPWFLLLATRTTTCSHKGHGSPST